MTDQSCDTAACKEKKKGATPPVCHAAKANDETSPSRAICPPITELICLHTDISPSLWRHGVQTSVALALFLQSDAQLHIVTDNKAASVETGSTLFFFPGKTSTFSPKAAKVKWAALGYNTFVTSVTRTHSLDALCRAATFDCGEETRASVCTHSCYFHLRGHMVGLADSQAPASVYLPQRLFGRV